MGTLENVIEAAKLAITEQIKNFAVNDKVIYREGSIKGRQRQLLLHCNHEKMLPFPTKKGTKIMAQQFQKEHLYLPCPISLRIFSNSSQSLSKSIETKGTQIIARPLKRQGRKW